MPHFVQDVEEIRQRAMRKIDEGAVTSTYGLDKNKTVNILNEALATEIVCVLRYQHHYFMATGVHGRTAAAEFKEHADDERDHAERVADRIQQLGGKPDFNPRTLMERSVSHYIEGETLADMIREDLVAERVVIDVYRKMIKFFGNNDPTTRILIEDILRDEEEHASDLTDLLYVVNPSTGQTEMQDPGTEIGRSYTEARMDRQDSETAYRQERSVARALANRNPGNERRTSEPGGGGKHGDRGDSSGEEVPAAGRKGVQPAHAPGTTGRVMGRRGRNEIALAEDDIAIGGQAGSSRSPKVVNKKRKKAA
jgi:bacterioferritin